MDGDEDAINWDIFNSDTRDDCTGKYHKTTSLSRLSPLSQSQSQLKSEKNKLELKRAKKRRKRHGLPGPAGQWFQQQHYSSSTCSTSKKKYQEQRVINEGKLNIDDDEHDTGPDNLLIDKNASSSSQLYDDNCYLNSPTNFNSEYTKPPKYRSIQSQTWDAMCLSLDRILPCQPSAFDSTTNMNSAPAKHRLMYLNTIRSLLQKDNYTNLYDVKYGSNQLSIPLIVVQLQSITCHGHYDITAQLIDESTMVMNHPDMNSNGDSFQDGANNCVTVVGWFSEEIIQRYPEWIRPGVVFLLKHVPLSVFSNGITSIPSSTSNEIHDTSDNRRDKDTMTNSRGDRINDIITFDENCRHSHLGLDGAEFMMLLSEETIIYAWVMESAIEEVSNERYLNLLERRSEMEMKCKMYLNDDEDIEERLRLGQGTNKNDTHLQKSVVNGSTNTIAPNITNNDDILSQNGNGAQQYKEQAEDSLAHNRKVMDNFTTYNVPTAAKHSSAPRRAYDQRKTEQSNRPTTNFPSTMNAASRPRQHGDDQTCLTNFNSVDTCASTVDSKHACREIASHTNHKQHTQSSKVSNPYKKSRQEMLLSRPLERETTCLEGNGSTIQYQNNSASQTHELRSKVIEQGGTRRQIVAKRTIDARVMNPYKKRIYPTTSTNHQNESSDGQIHDNNSSDKNGINIASANNVTKASDHTNQRKGQNLKTNVLTKYSVDTESTVTGSKTKPGANCVEKNMLNDDDARWMERKELEQQQEQQQQESKINSTLGIGNEYIYMQCNNASKLFEEVENEDECPICSSPQSATIGVPVHQHQKSTESETGINRMKETNSIFANLQDLDESDLDAFLEEEIM